MRFSTLIVLMRESQFLFYIDQHLLVVGCSINSPPLFDSLPVGAATVGLVVQRVQLVVHRYGCQ